jgi:acyl-CoA synthetase (AMP-forming)/AMP-acid ligase II
MCKCQLFRAVKSLTDVSGTSLRDYLAQAPGQRFIWDDITNVYFTELVYGTTLGGQLEALAGRSVLLASDRQLTTALALIELDGCARRLTILPPDTDANQLDAMIASAEIDAVIIDTGSPRRNAFNVPVFVSAAPSIIPMAQVSRRRLRTEWVLLTSGTIGTPKMVVHDLASLTGAIAAASPADSSTVWGTFYDIRRYGGLQIFLRAILGGASLVLSGSGEHVVNHLARLARHGVTHLSGTPSHWRRALMSPSIRDVTPRYVRLSGEIADQGILDSLRAVFPHAAVGHAYASTEAGVAFDVNDGLAGFPAGFVRSIRDDVELKIVDGSLRIRSPRTASCYIGDSNIVLADDNGFVDTGDIVERRGERFYYCGRKNGIVNIGGLKVHPEEIETVINQHPRVRMSLVRARHNPITGSIVVAEIVPNAEATGANIQPEQLKDDILKMCRNALAAHKVPAMITLVSALPVSATGKLLRRH